MQENAALTIISICVTVLTLVVAVYGVVVIVKTINSESFKKSQNSIKNMLNKIEEVMNELSYILINLDLGKIDDKLIEMLEEMQSPNSKNNLGVLYLEKSRLQTGAQRNYYLNLSKTYLEKAIILFAKCKKSIDRNKQLSLVYVNLADVYDDLGEQKLAIEQCETAINYNSSSSQAYNMLASILMATKQYEEALKATDKAILFDENNGYSYLTKTEILLAQDKVDEKEILYIYQKALDNGCPTWRYLSNLESNNLHKNLISTLKGMANTYEENYRISQMRLQTEHKYIL